MMDFLLTLLPTPIMLPPMICAEASEPPIGCGVDIAFKDESPPCEFAPAPMELPDEELPKEELLDEPLPNEELPNEDCDPPLSGELNPLLFPTDVPAVCPLGSRGWSLRLPINCPLGPT